ncbi:MAG: hypothetical protein ACJ71N_01470 [Terriglobales bacterium]|jgi:hypothetical protein
MFPKHLPILLVFTACSALALAQGSSAPGATITVPGAGASPDKIPATAAAPTITLSNKPISNENRVALIRGIQAEYIAVKKAFPQGKEGLTYKNGQLHPSDQEIRKLIATNGPAARPGDKSQITGFEFKGNSVILEINGGPQKKKKWYQRISVAGMGGETPVAEQSEQEANARGSVLIVQFDKFIPDMTVDQFKQYLAPVFDFKPLAGSEAYIASLPPKVRQALKEKRVLVGMDRDLVTLSKGRPDQKIREKDGDNEYEEWVFGAPPQDVEFVRFAGDEVVQDKIMKVGGEKVVRTEREIDMKDTTATAKATPAEQPAKKPTLRRPGDPEPEAQTQP